MAKTNQTMDISKNLELEPSPKRKWLKRFLILVVLTSIAATTNLVMKKNGEQSSIVQYKTQEVQKGNLIVIVSTTGTLQPTNQVDVSSELSGIIKTVEVDYNDKVKVGQVLARLDTSKLKSQVTQSQAALESAKAKVFLAQATVKETNSKLLQLQRLKREMISSQLELDAAEASFDRAKAEEASALAAVLQAKANLEVNEADLAKAVITSPINGVVLTRSVEPGQTVAASFQAPVLFTLAEDLTQMELHVDVDEADIGQVKEGQEALFTVDTYPNKDFQAKIIQCRYGSKTVDGVVTYETILKVNNKGLLLRPGMTATANITVKKLENILLLPNSALRFTMPVQEEKKSGDFIGSLLPRPPQSTKRTEEASSDKSQQRLWVLRDGKPLAVYVTVGDTNGNVTELIQGEIKLGDKTIVDIVSQ